jgi:O-methyltransferase involved in polyketide biosynthesis
MSETTNQNLSGVAETLLMTLYIRAMESQRLDALIKHPGKDSLYLIHGTDEILALRGHDGAEIHIF